MSGPRLVALGSPGHYRADLDDDTIGWVVRAGPQAWRAVTRAGTEVGYHPTRKQALRAIVASK